jgi:copper homeostasis protein
VRPILEAAVESVEAATAAQRAGAARVEVCVRLDEGGTTPTDRLIAAVVASLNVPVFVLIRTRAGDFLYSRDELAAMRREIAVAIQLGARGVALGALTSNGRIDVAATRMLVDAADGHPVTFHRAFDSTPDLSRALEDAIEAGAARVLTSGGAATAFEGADSLASLVRQAGSRITIVGAGRIRVHNVAAVVARTGVCEVHSRFEDEHRMRQLVLSLEDRSI